MNIAEAQLKKRLRSYKTPREIEIETAQYGLMIQELGHQLHKAGFEQSELGEDCEIRVVPRPEGCQYCVCDFDKLKELAGRLKYIFRDCEKKEMT